MFCALISFDFPFFNLFFASCRILIFLDYFIFLLCFLCIVSVISPSLYFTSYISSYLHVLPSLCALKFIHWASMVLSLILHHSHWFVPRLILTTCAFLVRAIGFYSVCTISISLLLVSPSLQLQLISDPQDPFRFTWLLLLCSSPHPTYNCDSL